MTVNEDQKASRRGGGSLSSWVLFLIGLLAGIALAAAGGIFLLGIGWATPLAAQSVISASPSPSPSATEGEASATGDVSEACMKAAEYNLEVDEAVDELAVGAESQDARILQEALGRLQAARDTAAGAAEECLAQAGGTSESAEPASPVPSPSSSSTP